MVHYSMGIDNGGNMEEYLADLVIVSFNTCKYLKECLDSIRENSGSYQEYRIWIVDNGSIDHSDLEIKKRPWVTGIMNRTNRGYGSACNQGIKAGSGRYIFLLNSDIKVTPGWMVPLTDTLASAPDIGVVGPRLVNPEGLLVGTGVVGTNAQPIIRGWAERDDPRKYSKPEAVLSVCGACMGIKRSLLPVLGFFDEQYFHYFEETDYCYNTRYHGYNVIYCPDSKVIHRVSGSCRNYRVLNEYYRKAYDYFQKKWADFLKDPRQYGQPPNIKLFQND
jgi:GT2 family glycosyltransferase